MEKSYCLEYSFLIGEAEKADFSYFESFKFLKEDEVIEEKCDGFGTIGITKIDSKPYLILENGTIESFDVVYSKVRLGEIRGMNAPDPESFRDGMLNGTREAKRVERGGGTESPDSSG